MAKGQRPWLLDIILFILVFVANLMLMVEKVSKLLESEGIDRMDACPLAICFATIDKWGIVSIIGVCSLDIGIGRLDLDVIEAPNWDIHYRVYWSSSACNRTQRSPHGSHNHWKEIKTLTNNSACHSGEIVEPE
jgi:hypothetical protein